MLIRGGGNGGTLEAPYLCRLVVPRRLFACQSLIFLPELGPCRGQMRLGSFVMSAVMVMHRSYLLVWRQHCGDMRALVMGRVTFITGSFDTCDRRVTNPAASAEVTSPHSKKASNTIIPTPAMTILLRSLSTSACTWSSSAIAA